MFNINYIILINKLELTREKQILLILEINIKIYWIKRAKEKMKKKESSPPIMLHTLVLNTEKQIFI